jgi:hypothetical protein
MFQGFVAIASYAFLSVGCAALPEASIGAVGSTATTKAVTSVTQASASPTVVFESPNPAPTVRSFSIAPSSGAGFSLPTASDLIATSVLDKPALFVSTGEDGRIAALIDEASEVVPYRREQSLWQRLPLPPSQRAKVGMLTAGIYFGRDNRPRVMGTRSDTAGIVYIRYKDDAWHPELREIGPLGKEGPLALFGVLGNADPEVVCRAGDRCLIKSRKGWQEARPTPTPNAVVRAFDGKGYVLTTEGAYRAEDPHFISVGPPPPWRHQPSGFWVGEGEALGVVDPISGELFTLDSASATWKTEELPIEHPTDVAGPPRDRFVSGGDGLIHYDGSLWARVPGVSGSLDRVIVASWGIVAAGRAGVFIVTRSP